MRELQEDVRAILEKIQRSEEYQEGTSDARSWYEWFMGSETEASTPEAPMGPREACRNFYECFAACTVMSLRMVKMVWLSVALPILGEKAEWVVSSISTYLPMNNFIELIRSLCLIAMCYQFARAILPAPVFEVLIQMLLSPFTLTRVIIWSMVDFVGNACFKEAWGNLKEYWEREDPDEDEDTTDTQAHHEPDRTPTNEGRTKVDEGTSLKDFCPSKRTIRSKKDLTGVIENVKFQIGDEFARIHALLQSLDDTDAATARFGAFVRKECAKIINAETLPQNSKKARICGIKVKGVWKKVTTKAQQYFAATGGDILASLQELQGLRKEAGEDLSQYIARYVSTWTNPEPSVPESKAIEVLLPALPRDFVRSMSTLSIHETTLAQVARAFRNYNEWLMNPQQPRVVQSPQRQFHAQEQWRAQPQPWRVEMRQEAQRGRPFVQRETRKCYNCGKTGHLAARCPARRVVREIIAPEGSRTEGNVRRLEQNPVYERSDSEDFARAPLCKDQLLDCFQPAKDQTENRNEEEASAGAEVNAVGYPIMAALPVHHTFAEIFVEKLGKTKCLLDTGACVSVVSKATLKTKGLDGEVDTTKKTWLRGFNGDTQSTAGVLILGIKHGKAICRVPFHVVEKDVETIIGYGALKQMRTVWDLGTEEATMGGQQLKMSTRN